MGQMIEAAKQLVERARQGDQNAMGVLMLVREEADKGVSKAIFALATVKDYIKKHPVDGLHGEVLPPKTVLAELKNAEPERILLCLLLLPKYTNGPQAGSAILANRVSLRPDHIMAITDMFGTEPKDDAKRAQFLRGMEHHEAEDVSFGSEVDERCFLAGQIMGKARAIQQVRQPNMPISLLCVKAAWELGE